MITTQEKVKRERWIEEKTKKIKVCLMSYLYLLGLSCNVMSSSDARDVIEVFIIK